MEVNVAWHKGNNAAERNGHGQRSLAFNREVTGVVSTGDSEAGKIKLEEAQTRGRSTNAGKPNLMGGGK